MPIKSKHPQNEIDKAVARYLKGESVSELAKAYKMSRAGMYLWIKSARENATKEARAREIGPKGVETEQRISKDLRLKQLEAENRELKQKLFELMLKHKEL